MNAPLVISSLRARTAMVAPYGFDMECSFEYDEGEPPLIGALGFEHPGYPPNVALLSCKVGGVDLMEMLSPSQQERIEDAILEQLES